MATHKHWFDKFALRHMDRHRRPDWPAIESGFWAGIKDLFLDFMVTEAEAEEASKLVFAEPPPFLDKIPPAFIAKVEELRRRPDAAGGVPADRETAERLSRGCDDCQGSGLAVRFRRIVPGEKNRLGKPIWPTVTFYCRCVLGRWMVRAARAGHIDIRVAIQDLEDFPYLWDNFREPPVAPGGSPGDRGGEARRSEPSDSSNPQRGV